MNQLRLNLCIIAVLELLALQASAAVVVQPDATGTQILAAREVRRYVYLRTGVLLPIAEKLPNRGGAIIIARDDSFQPQQYTLKAKTDNGRKLLTITGGNDIACLYGVYTFAEKLGVRFYLHGDVIPDEKIPFALPDVNKSHTPLFKLRGINPWGSHAEGIDLWNADDWKHVFAQMVKLRMNVLGVHCYPEKGGQYDSEPTVWIGLPGDFDDRGQVSFSCSASFFNTLRTQWGYISKPTGDYRFGASLLFERDDWGPDLMLGQCPVPTTLEGCNAVFNRTGLMFGEAFGLARELGVKTCIGTEAPLRIPALVKKRLVQQGKDPADPAVIREVYEGMFRRIAATHPLDYYWIWTPESWLWQGNTGNDTKTFVEDFKLAIQARDDADAPFELATCGWVLGPKGDRAAWYRSLPKETSVTALSEAYSGPVDPAFKKIEGFDKWAIPWMEEDTGLLGPQLWVARIRKDAADALAYGCTGLLGLHWRTREIGPTILALSRAGWSQTGWNPEAGKNQPGVPPSLKYEGPKPPYGRKEFKTASIDKPIAGTNEDTLYQNCRYNLRGYRLKVPSGRYRIMLKFCEPQFRVAGKRVFDVQLQERTVVENLDIFAQAGYLAALDLSFDDIEVKDGWLHIGLEFVQSEPCISAIVIQGESFARKINCGGMSYKDYEADPPRTPTFNFGPQGTAYEQRGLNCRDLYADWALHNFGRKVGPQVATIFTKLDGRIPLVSRFDGGAGALWPDARPWSLVAEEFAFLHELEMLRAQVKGAGNRERFDYWLNMFRHLRAQAKVCCIWGRLNAVVKEAEAEQDPAKRTKMIESKALPIREELTRCIGQAYEPLFGVATTPGGMATVVNWEGHVYKRLVKWRDAALAKVYGQPVPPEISATQEYRGRPRLIVPTARTMLQEGESLKLKVIVLDNNRPRKAALHWRPMGRGKYRRIDLSHVGRGVYTVTLPPARGQAIEYNILATTAEGKELVWPVTAPKLNQTVVVLPRSQESSR